MFTAKTKWTLVLFSASLLFLVGLRTQQPLFFIGTVGLAYLVHRKGYDVLFKAYDDQQKAKRAKSAEILKQLKEAKKQKTDGGIIHE